MAGIGNGCGKFRRMHESCLGQGRIDVYKYKVSSHINVTEHRVRNLKFATYLKFATCENTNKINEL